MARSKNKNVDATEEEPEEEMDEEELEELKEESEDDDAEYKEDAFIENMDLQEDYPIGEPEEKHTSHFIINKALEKGDTIRTTFLTESELGRPIFSVRFYSDLHDDALRLGLDRLADFYWQKIQNITSSGMSNKGFVMNLNVTQKRDMTRRRVKDNNLIQNQKK